MRIQKLSLRSTRLSLLSLIASIFVALAAGSASATSFSVGVQTAVATGELSVNIQKVHHRKKRWKKRFYFHIGTPYFGYSNYPSYYSYRRHRYCRKWTKICTYRYGWGSYRWDRCLRRRGC